MPRAVPAPYLFAFALSASLGGCAEDEAARPSPQQRASDAAIERTDGGDAASVTLDAASLRDGDNERCPNQPLSAGELQNRAEGSSVYGQVVSGALGTLDLLGDNTCGLAAVRICVFESETCTQSDAAGQYVLSDLPEATDLELSFEKDGFFATLRLAHLTGVPVNLNRTRLLRLEDRDTLLGSVGITPDDARGGVVAVPLTPGEGVGSVVVPAGVKIALMPGDPTPLYSRGTLEPGGPSSDELDPELEATREGGWALFANVEPGDYTVRFERAGEACTTFFPGFGFGVDEHGHVRIRVRAGFNTASVAVLCP